MPIRFDHADGQPPRRKPYVLDPQARLGRRRPRRRTRPHRWRRQRAAVAEQPAHGHRLDFDGRRHLSELRHRRRGAVPEAGHQHQGRRGRHVGRLQGAGARQPRQHDHDVPRPGLSRQSLWRAWLRGPVRGLCRRPDGRDQSGQRLPGPQGLALRDHGRYHRGGRQWRAHPRRDPAWRRLGDRLHSPQERGAHRASGLRGQHRRRQHRLAVRQGPAPLRRPGRPHQRLGPGQRAVHPPAGGRSRRPCASSG